MPLVIPDPPLERLVGSLAVEQALLRCAHRTSAGQARGALKRWFGDASPVFAVRVRAAVVRLAETIRTRDVKLTIADVEQSPPPSKVRDLVAWRPVILPPGIFALERHLALQGGEVAAVERGASQFCELVRALAHRLGGAVTGAVDGPVAAAALATDEPARAQASAENWAIFIEAVGVHRAS